ncbi:cytochrome c oxidase assembly protein [Sphingomonas jeddahensis]|uniref:Cytochrome c oxidase caa3 assembly factor n=1 Tax=Sphingomonas jeddahensis TaxID=1915074 RepID=A0A1V2ET82_9SPHN|nr:cytochrome c oxidase assembly protein [Sphingomonas jeddahensis]ONF95695.1 Cytochrome c oxidase caa3 assembly factor [Sphingomonas jeddahensis]
MNSAATWLPYCGVAPAPDGLMARWNGDPILIVALILAAGCYRLLPSNAAERRFFVAALALAALLFVSPLCALTSALFSARTVHHTLLTAVLAPLLAFALSPVARAPRGGIAIWTVVHIFAFWLWHAPPAYAAALSSDMLYWTMQASLLVTAWGMWAHIRTAALPFGIAALLALMVQMGLLGALLVFNADALYAPHYLSTQAWGFSPLEDQQLAGLIMWAPAAGFYLAGALWMLARWLGVEERGEAVTAR